MSSYVPCPKCGGSAEPVKFTWWGGFLGPKMINQVKCVSCGYNFNGKNGRDHLISIFIYCAVIAVLAFVFVFGIFLLGALIKIAT
jgi:rubredoxin